MMMKKMRKRVVKIAEVQRVITKVGLMVALTMMDLTTTRLMVQNLLNRI